MKKRDLLYQFVLGVAVILYTRCSDEILKKT
jgi:hypothetical protein